LIPALQNCIQTCYGCLEMSSLLCHGVDNYMH
jgi:hypothetical protein